MKKSSEETKEWKLESSHKVLKLLDFSALIYYYSDFLLIIYKLLIIEHTQAMSIELV